MHKTLASGFASILSVLHFIAALLLMVAVIAVVFGMGGSANLAQIFVSGLGAILGYVLLFGLLSTIIRINQNLERIADASDIMASQQEAFASTMKSVISVQSGKSKEAVIQVRTRADEDRDHEPLANVTRQ
ncbi:MAG: hypothetical protein ABNH26_10515 [Celeribacter sp.]|jgi:uncharacterized membrane protein required for colicin V production